MSMPQEWVIVTGGNRGIGFAITQHLLTNGYGVIPVHRSESSTDMLIECERLLPQAVLSKHGIDITNGNHVKNLFSSLIDARCDVIGLVNCAGVQLAGNSIENFRTMFETNVFGPWLMTNCFTLYRSIKSPDAVAAVVNIGSTSGLHGDTSNPLYAASKAALHRLVTASLTAYPNMRLNVIICGPVADERAGMNSEALEVHRKNTPTGRLTKPEEVAYMAKFLIRERAHLNMHGAAIALDGARTRHKI